MRLEQNKEVFDRNIEFKKFLNWETSLFALVNFFILTNTFFILDVYIAEFIVLKDRTVNGPAGGASLLLLPIIMMPIFVLLKYLLLPLTILTIQKLSKNEIIKHLIRIVAVNYKVQSIILFFAITADIIFSFASYIVCRYYLNCYFNTFLGELLVNLIIFGGLTGSYLAIFLFLFIRKKLKK